MVGTVGDGVRQKTVGVVGRRCLPFRRRPGDVGRLVRMILDELDKFGGNLPLPGRHVPGLQLLVLAAGRTDHSAALAASPGHQVDGLLLALVEVLLGGGDDHRPVDAELLAEEEEVARPLRLTQPDGQEEQAVRLNIFYNFFLSVFC